MPRLLEKGLVYWQRYVDDTFAIIKASTDLSSLLDILNSFHPSIQFTSEPDMNGTLSFLGINIKRLTTPTTFSQSHFETTVYRQLTYTGLLTKVASSISIQYKRSALSSMIYRAIRICSIYQLLHKEFRFTKRIATANGYPVHFIEKQIAYVLNKHQAKTSPTTTASPDLTATPQTPTAKPTARKDILLIDNPFVGRPTTVLGKRLIKIATVARPELKLQPIPRSPPAVRNHLRQKDPLPRDLQSPVVYEIGCSDCDPKYNGKTIRQASRRHREHGAPQPQNDESQPSHETSLPTTTLRPWNRKNSKANSQLESCIG